MTKIQKKFIVDSVLLTIFFPLMKINQKWDCAQQCDTLNFLLCSVVQEKKSALTAASNILCVVLINRPLVPRMGLQKGH